MTLVTRRHESGLILAEKSEGWAGLRRALKQIDRQLVLWPPDAMSPYWRVLRRVADDQPCVEVLVWMDDNMNPLPLSSGILEAVQRLRVDGRNQGPTADERNAQLHENNRKQSERDREALKDEYRPYLDHERVGVSMATVKRKPYWMRRWKGGEF